DANLKLLRSLPSAWNNIALIMRNKTDLDTLSMDDLYNNLKVYEAEIKGQSSSSSNSQNVAFISSENTSSTNEAVNTAHEVSTASSQGQASSLTYVDDVMFSFFANQSNSLQLDNEDIEHIDTDDLEEMDHKWQVAMLTMRVECHNCHRRGHFARECRALRNHGNRNRDAPRRVVPVETTTNALVVQDGIGGYDWSFQAEKASAGTEGPIPPKTAEQKLARKNELKAKSTLLLAIPDEHLLKFHGIEDANTLWEAIKASQMELHGEVISQEDANLKLLKSLPSAWNNISLIMRNKSDLDTLSIDDLYNNLKVYESKIKGQSSSSSNSQNVAFVSLENTRSTNEAVNTAYDVTTASSQGQASSSTYVDDVLFSFFASQSNSPQFDYEDLEQIDTDDLEEMDLKWQVAILTMRVKRFLKKAGRNLNFNGKETVGFDKTKVGCYNYHRRGHFPRECRAPRNQGNRNEDNTRRVVPVETPINALVVQDGIGGYDWSFQAKEGITNFALMAYTSQSSSRSSSLDFELEEALKEKVDLKFKLEKYEESSKNLTKLINSQISAKDKAGLGYDSQMNESEVVHSVFNSRETEVDDSPDLKQTSKDIVEKPKPVRPNAPIIEDWDTDSDNDRNTHRRSRVIQKSQSPSGYEESWNGDDAQKLGNGFEFIKKACCGSFNHLIKDCDFHDNKMLQATSDKACLMLAKAKLSKAATSIRTARDLVIHNILYRIKGFLTVDALRHHDWKTCPFLQIIQAMMVDLCDNGIEFKNNDMNQLRGMKGIKREFSVARILQQNRVAERKNRTLIEAARTMLANSLLPTTFWAEASSEDAVGDDVGQKTNEEPANEGERNGQEKEGGASKKEDDQNVQDFRAKLDNLLVQQKKGYANSTNKDSIVSPYFSTAGKNFINVDDLHTDPLMLDLEDIANLLNTGIFSGAYDDENVGAEPDLNNLVTTMNVKPKKVTRALTDPNWIEAMQDELLQFRLQKVWRLVDLPKGKHAIGTKWVNRNKKDERGIVVRNKSRLMDVKSAFLYGTIEEEVYVCQPPGFDNPQFPDKVYKVEKALYGLHQALRAWYETLSTYLLENGFRRRIIDKTLFIKKDKEFESLMHKKFQMSSMGEHTFFLGLQVMQRDDGIFISQDKFQVTPKVSHLHAVKRIFRYLKGQPKLGLWYPRDSPFHLEAFSDIANSTIEAEYVAATNCCGQNPVFHSKTKNIEIRHHFIRDSYENRLIQVIKIHIDHNVADLFTKAFDVNTIRDKFGNKTGSCKVNAARQSRMDGRTCNIEQKYVKSQTPRQAKRGRDTKIPQSGGPPEKVGDEAVHKELGDRMERAATTASSLEAEQDSELELILPGINLILPFRQTASTSTSENGEMEITATIDGRVNTVTEASIRRHLNLEDFDGINILPNTKIFEQLALMGYVSNSDRLTFQKGYFSPQ
ncbi:putative ribonuclease H-like domain-containing protein, partial [Tanacetum coccineum]